MARILLVGGAGYIGSVLAHKLLERGYAVRVLDRLYFGDIGLRDIRERIELVVGDMRHAINADVFQDVDCVVNVGGLSNDPTADYSPQANHEMNTVAAIRLAGLCVANGIRRYIFASSCSVYDRGTNDERDDVLLDEMAEVNPRVAYSSSKHEAEKALLSVAGNSFCPVILRKGTVYGFSPRMRYDLVVNTFVKDALTTGKLVLHNGGEMWRPLIDVGDVADVYITCIEADREKVEGQIFNVASSNVRVSELALQVRAALHEIGCYVEITSNYGNKIRSYRVSAEKIRRVLGFRPRITIEESVWNMVKQIGEYGYTDFGNPRYYNIQWMKTLEEAHRIISVTDSVF